jgi:predicted helicase
MALATKSLVDLHLVGPGAGTQCFPFYTYDEDGTNRRENITDWALQHFCNHYKDGTITKWDIFYYVYGVLHHPVYREKFAENLKRDLPRIPLINDVGAGLAPPSSDNGRDSREGRASRTPTSPFWTVSRKELADLHVDYEALDPYPLQWMENRDLPLSYRVEDKMRLSKDKRSVKVNDSLTLAGIPPETFQYRLGNRSALEWVIDQYQVTEDKKSGIRSDPNRTGDPEYIVRLVGQVVKVSLETVGLVASLPPLSS